MLEVQVHRKSIKKAFRNFDVFCAFQFVEMLAPPWGGKTPLFLFIFEWSLTHSEVYEGGHSWGGAKSRNSKKFKYPRLLGFSQDFSGFSGISQDFSDFATPPPRVPHRAREPAPTPPRLRPWQVLPFSPRRLNRLRLLPQGVR